MFPQRLASVYGVQISMMAKHYCSQFHPDLQQGRHRGADQGGGCHNWTELFIKKCAVDTEANERWQNPDRPTMEPWVIKDPYIGGATLVTLKRNPYYHKVDPEGNQLPYIDDLSISVNADKQTLVLKVVNGEIDYQDRHINANANRAVFLDAAEKADIRLVDGPNADMNTTIISLNLTHKDPVKREIFNNKDFRIGLSYAIDRQAIIDSAFVGPGRAVAGGAAQGVALLQRAARQAVHRVRRRQGQRVPRQGLSEEGRRRLPSRARRQAHLLQHHGDPGARRLPRLDPARGAVLAGRRRRCEGADRRPHAVLRSQGQ